MGKFIKHFWKYKGQWQMWLRLSLLPLFAILILTSGVGKLCDELISLANNALPTIKKEGE